MKHLIFLWSFLLLNISICAQTIRIQIISPLQVCDKSNVTIKIDNNTASDFIPGELKLRLPCGFKYVGKSIMGASEKNLADLKNPIFNLPKIDPNKTLELKLEVDITCEAISCIDDQSIFDIDAVYTSGAVVVNKTSSPFNVNTAFLVVTAINEPFMVTQPNSTVLRSIKVKNTRKGSLSSFLFSDKFNGDIEITSNQGKIKTNTNTEFAILLDSTDFKQVGNKDNFLDFNEEISIQETILVKSCGLSQQNINSSIQTSWSCNNATSCQSTQSYATIKVAPLSDKGNKVGVRSFPTDPFCYLPGSATQKLDVIVNPHKHVLLDLTIKVTQLGSGRGIKLGTMTVPKNGKVRYFDVTKNSCGDSIANYALIYFTTLEQNSTVMLTSILWQSVFCEQPDCVLPRNNWSYSYSYSKECAEFDDTEYASDTFRAISLDESVLSASSLITGEVRDNASVSIDFLTGSYRYTGSGILHIKIEIPAIIKPGNFDYKLGNSLPTSKEIIENNGSTTTIKLQYKLPLSNDTVSMQIPATVDCGFISENQPCVREDFATCPYDCDEKKILLPVTTYAMIDHGVNCPIEGSPKSCYISSVASFCDNVPICYDTLPGYLNFKMDFFRINYGFSDNDRNKLEDNVNILDTSALRRWIFFPGDTMVNIIKGPIVTDIKGSRFSELLLRWYYSEIGSVGTQEQEFFEKLILDSEDGGLKQFSSILKIYDASENMLYTFPSMPHVYINGIVNYDLSANALRQFSSTFPADFLYEHGDSIYLEIKSYFDLEVFKEKQQEIKLGQFFKFSYSPDAVLGNTKPEFDKWYPSVCHCLKINAVLSSFNFSNPQSIFSIYNEKMLCQGDKVTNFFSRFNVGHVPTELNKEVRPSARMKKMKIYNLQGFQLLNLNVEFNEKVYSFSPQYFDGYTLYDFGNTFPSGGYFVGNEYLYSINKKLTADCLKKVVPKEVDYFIYLEKNEVGNLVLPDSVKGRYGEQYMNPDIALNLDQDKISAFRNIVETSMEIKETTSYKYDIDHVFVRLRYSSKMKEVNLYDPITGATFDLSNGIYYIGKVDKSKPRKLAFKARSESCGQEIIIIDYGFNCSAYTNPALEPCFLKSDTLEVLFPESVVDIDVVENSSTLTLCTDVEKKFLVFNAGLGTAYDMEVKLNIPPGASIVLNSARIIFPAGGTNSFAIPNAQFVNNEYIWNLKDIWPSHKSFGLAGVKSEPGNSFEIVYTLRTECNFYSGTAIKYQVSAFQLCGDPTNSILAVTNPLNINGVIPPYQVDIMADYTLKKECPEDSLFVLLQFKKPNLSGGELNIALPPELTFVKAISNLANTIPAIDKNNVRWELDTASDSIKMLVILTGKNTGRCSPEIIQIFTSVSSKALCASTNEICDLQVVTGNKDVIIPQNVVSYQINDFTIQLDESNTAIVNVSASITASTFYEDLTSVIFIDANENQSFDLGEVVLDTIIFSGFGPNKTIVNITQLIPNVLIQDLCKLAMYAGDEINCICSPIIEKTSLSPTISATPISICSGDVVEIGISENSGQFQWNSDVGMSCTQCASALFSLENNGANSISTVKTLFYTNNSGCVIEYMYAITINAKPSVLTEDVNICLGDTLTIISSSAKEYNWEGPNIIQKNGPLMLANPSKDATYFINLTDDFGCTGLDSISVKVHPKPSAQVISDSIFCFGPPALAQVQLDTTSTKFIWKDGSNRLKDKNQLTSEIIGQEDFTLSLELRNMFCLNTISLPIKFEPSFALDGIEDQILSCKGETLAIKLPSAYSYTIEPQNKVECTVPSCNEFNVLTDFDQQTFMIVAKDNQQCIVETSIQIKTTNSNIYTEETLFLCSGDSILVFDQYVDKAGTYCDTIGDNQNCLKINCKLVRLKPSLEVTSNESICAGENFTFFDQVITAAGKYCTTTNGLSGQCDTLQCVQLSVDAIPDLSSIAVNYTVTNGDSIELSAPTNFSTYLWSPSTGLSCTDCPNPIANPLEDTEYRLLVTNTAGCATESRIFVKVVPKCFFQFFGIPNAFTPNGDGINDIYSLNSIGGCGPISIVVFNRWGNVVYEDKNWNNAWDGNNLNNEPLAQGTYYVYVRFTNSGIERKGMIDLRRE